MKRFLIGLVILFVTFGLALVMAMVFFPPVLKRPKPTGQYPVGYLETTLTDASRTMLGNQPRVISLDVWYPASSIGTQLEPYTTAELRQILQKVQGIPSIGGDDASYSYRNAPALSGRHKVILFNHGQPSFTKQNFSNMEELASHGYVVISLGHPEDSLLARDANNQSIEINLQNPVYQRSKAFEKNLQVSVSTLSQDYQKQRQAKTFEQHKTATVLLSQNAQYANLSSQIPVWVADTRFVMQSLQNGIGALPFIDPDWMVISGHSFGGMVALNIGQTKTQGLRGIISLDAPWIGQPLAVPALVMASTDFKYAGADVSLHGTFDLPLSQGRGAYLIEPEGTAHFNFSDLNYIPVLKLFTPILGGIEGKYMGKLLNSALLEYLRQLEQGTDFSKVLLPETSDLRQKVFKPQK
jgi:hypothetical protein